MMQEATNIYVQPQQVVLSAGPDSASNIGYAHKHYRRWILGLGIFEVAVGIALIITGIAVAVNAKDVKPNYSILYIVHLQYDPIVPKYSTYGEGIWGGIFVTLPGILGIITGLEKGKWKSAVMITHMVFSVIGSIISFVITIIGITSLNQLVFHFIGTAMGLLIASTAFSSGFLGCLKTERLQFVYGGYVPYQPMKEQEITPHSTVGYTSSSWNPIGQGQNEMAAYTQTQYTTSPWNPNDQTQPEKAAHSAVDYANSPWNPTDGPQPNMEPVQDV